VAQVDDLRLWGNPQDHPLHYAYVAIFQSKIRHQGYQAHSDLLVVWGDYNAVNNEGKRFIGSVRVKHIAGDEGDDKAGVGWTGKEG
jgi:hypothetical protein